MEYAEQLGSFKPRDIWPHCFPFQLEVEVHPDRGALQIKRIRLTFLQAMTSTHSTKTLVYRFGEQHEKALVG